MSALSPSTLFINSNAVKPNDPIRMDATDSPVTKEFTLISNPVEQINTEFDDGHQIKTSAIKTNQEPEQMVRQSNDLLAALIITKLIS